MSLSCAALVKARQRGQCACGCGRPIAPYPIGFHHVFPKAKWPELADTMANVVGVSRDCHANHESGARRLRLGAVACALPLIADGSMASYIERTYPLSR